MCGHLHVHTSGSHGNGPQLGVELKFYHPCIKQDNSQACAELLRRTVDALLRRIREFEMQKRLALACKHQKILDLFASQAPDIPVTGLVVPSMSASEREEAVRNPAFKGIYFEKRTLLEADDGHKLLKLCKRLGKYSWVWVVDDEGQGRRLLRMGVTKVISNRYKEFYWNSTSW